MRRFGDMEAGKLVSETVVTLPSGNMKLALRQVNM
jgi:hypothetical protein